MYFVYMVYCKGDTLYTGVAQDICRRMRQHTDRGNSLRPVYTSPPNTGIGGAVGGGGQRDGPAAGIPHQAADPDGEGTPYPGGCCFSQLLPQLEVSRYRRRPGVTLEMCLEGKIDA